MGKHVSTTILIMQYGDTDLTLSLSTSAGTSPSDIRLILCTPHVTATALVLQLAKMRILSEYFITKMKQNFIYIYIYIYTVALNFFQQRYLATSFINEHFVFFILSNILIIPTALNI